MIKYEKIIVSETEVIKGIFDNESILFIPMDEKNTDYQAYLKWVAEGNVAEEHQPK
jgi:hypothetical protein